MEKIKVAHITTVDCSLRTLLLNQLRSLQSEGYELVGISSAGPDVPAIEAAGVRHIAVPMTRSVTPLADIRSLVALWKVFRQEGFTIVHTHNPKPGLLAQLAARLAGVPVVIHTIHGLYFHEHMGPAVRKFYVLLETLAARCSDVIFSQNKEDLQTCISERICPPQRIKYLGNGIDLSLFNASNLLHWDEAQKRAQYGIPEGVKVVGFVGRFTIEKGFVSFLKASREIVSRFKDVRFLIIGGVDADKKDAVSPSLSQELGVAEYCRFVGLQPNAGLPGLYALMDVLVLPSNREGLPRCVIEAAAMGVPAVVTDVKGNREVVEHGRNGLLVPFGDIDALAGAILDVVTDTTKARAMGEEGRRIARERFDEQVVFKKVMREYSRLLADKGFHVPVRRAWVRET